MILNYNPLSFVYWMSCDSFVLGYEKWWSGRIDVSYIFLLERESSQYVCGKWSKGECVFQICATDFSSLFLARMDHSTNLAFRNARKNSSQQLYNETRSQRVGGYRRRALVCRVEQLWVRKTAKDFERLLFSSHKTQTK